MIQRTARRKRITFYLPAYVDRVLATTAATSGQTKAHIARCAVIDASGPERVVLREIGPGDIFGETAIFGSTHRTATVEALDDVVLTVVTRDALVAGVGLNSWMGRFVKALANRFSDVDQRLRDSERPSSPKTAG